MREEMGEMFHMVDWTYLLFNSLKEMAFMLGSVFMNNALGLLTSSCTLIVH